MRLTFSLWDNMHTVVESSNTLLQYITGAAATTFLVNAPAKIDEQRYLIHNAKIAFLNNPNSH